MMGIVWASTKKGKQYYLSNHHLLPKYQPKNILNDGFLVAYA